MNDKPKYFAVNSKWPEGTNDGRTLKPTPQEALTAARRLYRYAMKRPFRGKVQLTSGNRYTWVRNHVMHVNPDMRGGGWHELVHMLSHLCAQRLFPHAGGHGPQHESLERDMICHVIESGWLDGKLKRPERPAPDRNVQKRESIERRLKAWETKRKRAETALRKLRAQQKRIARAIASAEATS